MIEAEWWDHESAEELAEAVAGDIGFVVESAVEARGSALLALPGGSAARPVFAQLAKAKLPWKKVTIIPTDDGLVPVDHELSSARQIAQAFLPTGARVYPIATVNDDHKLAGNAADARLQELAWPPDLVWLGMDEAGNTAGICLGADLQSALDSPKGRRAVGVLPDPLPAGLPMARVTLTRGAILAARTIIVTVHGDEQRRLLERAIADGPLSPLPIGRVLAEAEQPIDIHWARE